MEENNYCPYFERGLRLHFNYQKEQLHVQMKPCCHLDPRFIPAETRTWIPVDNFQDLLDRPEHKYWQDYYENNNDFPKACHNCVKVESFRGEHAPRLGAIKRDNTDKYDYFKLDIVIGNTCNLACTFCKPDVSSLIAKVAKDNYSDDMPITWKKNNGQNSNSALVGKLTAQFLEKYSVKYVKFIGGEPLLKENWEPIGKVIDKGYLDKSILEITTNGTVVNQKMLDRFSKVDEVILRMSIDSIGKNYDFLRWPHTWNKMDRNLKFLLENKSDNINFGVAVLINVWNIEYLGEIEKYFNNLGISPGFTFDLKPGQSVQHYTNAHPSIINHAINNSTNQSSIDFLTSENSIWTNKNNFAQVKTETQWFLKQRGMTSDVLGPMTREWLEI